MYGSGSTEQRERSRSPKKESYNLKFEEQKEPARLARHEGAQRNNKPAWMTKGLGVGEEMFGKPKGIIKPGDEPGVEKKAVDLQPGYDPMGDVFRTRDAEKNDSKSAHPDTSSSTAASTATATSTAMVTTTDAATATRIAATASPTVEKPSTAAGAETTASTV